MDHVARLDTSPDAITDAPACSVCGERVIGTAHGDQLRHLGEARRPRLIPARADLPAVRRAKLLAERALTEVTWTPHVTDADRAAAVVETLYAAGMIAARPRSVRTRTSTARRGGRTGSAGQAALPLTADALAG